jgi:glucokinase
MLLVADVGGTHGRFGVVAEGETRPRDVGIERGDAHATLDRAVAAYLDRASVRPRRAAFAVAGPVEGRRARITNRPTWEIDADALAARFGFADVVLMNDFAAQAACLPHLAPSETVPIGAAAARPGVKVAVGPGTGLGVAALLPDGEDWRPLPGEGGHVEFAAASSREAAAFDAMRRRCGRVSAEDVLSGPGMTRLHRALAEVDGVEAADHAPADLVAAAAAGPGRASETVAVFLAGLARFAGDVALTFGAAGGVYLCGGVVPKMLDLIEPEAFRAHFEGKTPHEAMMRAIPTAVVTTPVAGLIGCAAAARSHRTAKA